MGFDPINLGAYMDSISLDTDAGLVQVPMSGVCAPPGVLTISPLVVDYGTVSIGASPVASFTVANTGGSSLRITRSKPPASGIFNALTSLPEGTTLVPGQTVTEYVSFIPATAGTATDTWSLNGDDGGGAQNVSFTGVATATTDYTASGTIIALITSPTGGGSRNLEVIRDGVMPPVGSTDYSLQYDTFNGGAPRPEDWIGYSFASNKSFNKLVFQEGGNFYDGGSFASLRFRFVKARSG